MTTPFLRSQAPWESDVLQLDDSTVWSLSSCKDVGISVIRALKSLSCSIDVPSDNGQEAVVCQGSLHRLKNHAEVKSKQTKVKEPVKGYSMKTEEERRLE